MTKLTLAELGWRQSFLAQTDGIDLPPARLSGVSRAHVDGLTEAGPVTLTCPPGLSTGDLAVGDWVLCDPATFRIERLLARDTSLQRRAAGPEAKPQLIVANVDTLAIVTSCNADFNEARIERYLALAASGGCLPLIILTKADLVEDPSEWRKRAERLSPMASAVALNAKDPEDIEALAPWAGPGQTLALVGSSGTGKSTITNALTGGDAATQDIRDDDAKGRHTTTARSLRRALAGGWIIDTPGMRELALTDAATGIAEVFADLETLAIQCKFSNCAHDTEPGCAVRAAIDAGDLEEARLHRWQKLLREDSYNSETVAEARARQKGFAKQVRKVTKTRRDRQPPR